MLLSFKRSRESLRSAVHHRRAAAGGLCGRCLRGRWRRHTWGATVSAGVRL